MHHLRRSFAGAAAAAALVTAVCLCLLWRNPGMYWNDDYQISILPVFADVARAWSEGHWPLLSPYSWACSNLAGEYQYGTFSFFINALVVVVWKLPLTFAQQAAALSIAHQAVLAAGAYLLAREKRLLGILALGVGMIAALNGWIVGWGATDWFGAVAAEAWLPWCWWSLEVALRAEGGGRRGRLLRALLPVPFIYLLLTAGFPYTVVMLVLVTAWLGLRTYFERGGNWRRLLPLVPGWVLGALWSAPALLSLFVAIHGSGRATEGVGGGNTAWTVPLSSLPGLILPNWTTIWKDFGNHPSPRAALELAGGLVPLAALAAALTTVPRRTLRTLRWELGLAATVLLLCLLPSPGLFRWSFRWLPLLHLVLALIGARALLLLASCTRRARKGWHAWVYHPGTWATLLVAAAWLAMLALRKQNDEPAARVLSAWTLGLAVLWAASAWWRGSMLVASTLAVLAFTLTTYLHLHTNPGLPVYPVGENLRNLSPLQPGRLYLSLYREPDQFYRDWQKPPGFGAVVRMGSTGMFAGVHMINGYSPIMAAGIGRRLHLETHGNIPESIGSRLLDPADPELGTLLEELGVDGLLLASDYQSPAHPPDAGWADVFQSPEGTVYHRRGEVVSDVRETPTPQAGTASSVIRVRENSRHRVVAELEIPSDRPAPVTLTFRRAFFPGYQATFNGRALAVSAFDGLMPSVQLPAGSRGQLVLRYLPPAVVWGAALAALGLVATATMMVRALSTED